MTDLKFSLLKFLYQSPNHEHDMVDLLNQRLGPMNDVQMALDDMLINGDRPLIVRPVGKNTLKMTVEDNIAYELEQEKRDEQAKREKQYRFNKKTAIISILVALVTSVIALIEFFMLLF